MTEKERWVAIDVGTFDGPTEITLRDRTYTILLPESQLPRAVSVGSSSHESGRVDLVFRYDDEETPSPWISAGDHAWVRLGRFSRKLMAIRVSLDGHGADGAKVSVADEIAFEAEQALQILNDGPLKISTKANYGVALDGLRESIPFLELQSS